ncbi:MAG: DUF2279 domain-containing protein [Bacteroidales bacterium]|nr:DUF2279 domain-containing protein [Bacteroidales bacterium]
MLTVTLNANFLAEDDKQKHIATTTIISLVASNIAYEYNYTETQSFWIGFATAMAVGISKELYDSRSGGSGFDMEDLGADVIGSTLGALPVLIIYKW